MVNEKTTYTKEEYMELHEKYVKADNEKDNLEHIEKILTEQKATLTQEVKELKTVVINQSKELHG